MDRRHFLQLGLSLSAGLALRPGMGSVLQQGSPVYELPALPFQSFDLAPYFDEATMRLHHGKHHASYVARLNAESSSWASRPPIEDLMRSVSKYSLIVRNHGGGHFNHSFFWKILCPPNSKSISEELQQLIEKKFGSLDAFKQLFKSSALSVFGSGWVWLILNRNNELEICTSPNQDNPLMDIAPIQGKPLLGLDLWEHAYYLNYQNKRGDYVDAFWPLVNWDQVAFNLRN